MFIKLNRQLQAGLARSRPVPHLRKSAVVEVVGEFGCRAPPAWLGVAVLEALVGDEGFEPDGGGFGCAGPRGVVEVDVVDAEPLAVARVPLEVVHQRPRRVAFDVAAVVLDG